MTPEQMTALMGTLAELKSGLDELKAQVAANGTPEKVKGKKKRRNTPLVRRIEKSLIFSASCLKWDGA